ncbi:MAG: hypothetical protein DRR03_07405 [Gammaproteobacteria bacterium]|nr:MAG: hypothetical protein DRR03_07405 [Gammaproteobacteria bacterium]
MTRKSYSGFPGSGAGRSAGVLVGIGLLVGIVGTAGFQTALHMTSTEQFCISCHTMRDNVYAEYQGTIHDSNASGVRAERADCHVPNDFVPLLVAKVMAAKDLYHEIKGTVDTTEKFDAMRLQMANKVWASMRANDSRECRSCHADAAMNTERQTEKAVEFHRDGLEQGKTCIDCHKGVAHKLPKEVQEAADRSAGLESTRGDGAAAADKTE